ncbi:MAG TPA: hypothetical protein ENH59_01975 [Bacteroidetes bacterium]|nr:hypothetical protein [Bacteroidota bacterium]
MKKYYLILLFVFCISSLYAQRNRREVIEAQKVAFLTRNLELSPEEARLFWPIYDEFTAERDKIIRQRNAITHDIGNNFRNMTEKKLEEAGDELVRLNLTEAELKVEYHEKFKEVLTPSKVVRLYYTENRFKNYLLNQLRSRGVNKVDNVRKLPDGS